MVVEIKDLIIEYELASERFTAVDVPAWSVAQGSQVAIFGPSGSGKSTLLHVIAGLLSPTSGSVTVCGKELTLMGTTELDRFRAAHIGYIFQDFNLLQGYTAEENILLGMTFSCQKPDRHRVKELLDRVGLSHRMKHRPAELSIGERQRVAIARALARKPELILADEPTGSLDPLHAGDVVRLLKETTGEYGCSLIVVSHDPGVVNSFDQSVPYMELNRAFCTAPFATSAAGGVA